MDDQKVIKTLSSLRGIGVWTAEMLLIFCMQRPDVLSYGDGAILNPLGLGSRHQLAVHQVYAAFMELDHAHSFFLSV